jgi:hypothetical protein
MLPSHTGGEHSTQAPQDAADLQKGHLLPPRMPATSQRAYCIKGILHQEVSVRHFDGRMDEMCPIKAFQGPYDRWISP